MDASPAAAILRELRSGPSRTWSVVVTVFGDVAVPRGGSLWLGSLLDVFAGMGVGANAVRTAMSRLTADGWLLRDRVGRNSFYRLGARGRAGFAPATERIYGAAPDAWDGRLDLWLPAGETGGPAAPEGFGAVASGVWLAPLSGEPRPDAPGWMRVEGRADLATGRRLAARAWPVAATADAYARFMEAFSPLREQVAGAGAPSGLDALIARILLIHEYRRVVLRDPRLPLPLLPDPWPGTPARALCADIYRALLPESEAWLDLHARDKDGPLPPSSIDLRRRFG